MSNLGLESRIAAETSDVSIACGNQRADGVLCGTDFGNACAQLTAHEMSERSFSVRCLSGQPGDLIGLLRNLRPAAADESSGGADLGLKQAKHFASAICKCAESGAQCRDPVADGAHHPGRNLDQSLALVQLPHFRRARRNENDRAANEIAAGPDVRPCILSYVVHLVRK